MTWAWLNRLFRLREVSPEPEELPNFSAGFIIPYEPGPSTGREFALVTSIEILAELLTSVYTLAYPNEQTDIGRTLSWAIWIGLITDDEADIWRHAVATRNAVLQRRYRVAEGSLIYYLNFMDRLIETVRERIRQLPPDDENVVQLRRP
jgi:uncharacterized protein YutE (UPF0331/DUF86 family)